MAIKVEVTSCAVVAADSNKSCWNRARLPSKLFQNSVNSILESQKSMLKKIRVRKIYVAIFSNGSVKYRKYEVWAYNIDIFRGEKVINYLKSMMKWIGFGFFSPFNEHVKPVGMSNTYKCKYIGQREAKLETLTLSVLFDYDFRKWNTSGV